MDLIDQFIDKLKRKAYTVTVAESCTGGLIASAITAKAGASKVFDRGFVTYSNEAKMDMLGVPSHILEQSGAVSVLCAEAMVKGALQRSNTNIALSVTGIAGPDGGTAEKPVGLVFIGYCEKGELPKVAEHNFRGNREEIRMQAVKQAVQYGLSLLN